MMSPFSSSSSVGKVQKTNQIVVQRIHLEDLLLLVVLVVWQDRWERVLAWCQLERPCQLADISSELMVE
jgi:hypothetical protein